MLENEIKVVDRLINVERVHCISENRLKWLCRDDYSADYKMVVAILKSEYNATYTPSDDPHFCGDYSFDNPNLQKQDYCVLKYLYKDDSNSKVNRLGVARMNSEKCYEVLAKEVLRLENIKTPLEYIAIALKEEKVFVGKDRIWLVTIEKDY